MPITEAAARGGLRQLHAWTRHLSGANKPACLMFCLVHIWSHMVGIYDGLVEVLTCFGFP